MALDDLWNPHGTLGADGSLDDFRLRGEVANWAAAVRTYSTRNAASPLRPERQA